MQEDGEEQDNARWLANVTREKTNREGEKKKESENEKKKGQAFFTYVIDRIMLPYRISDAFNINEYFSLWRNKI